MNVFVKPQTTIDLNGMSDSHLVHIRNGRESIFSIGLIGFW